MSKLEVKLHLYAVGCACGFEDQAKYVARNAELPTVMAHSDVGDLRGLTLGPYHNLVSFLAQSDSEWTQILVDAKIPQGICCNCDEKLTWDLYNRIKMDLKGPYLRTEEVYRVYLRALEDRSRQLGCTAKSCSVTDLKIKAFIEEAAKERERLCDKFVPETSEPGPLSCLIPGPPAESSLFLHRPLVVVCSRTAPAPLKS